MVQQWHLGLARGVWRTLVSSQVTRHSLHLHRAKAKGRNYRSSLCSSIYRSVCYSKATSFGETTGETLDPNLFSSSSPRLQLPDQEPQAPNSKTSQDTSDFHRSIGREHALLEHSPDTTSCTISSCPYLRAPRTRNLSQPPHPSCPLKL